MVYLGVYWGSISIMEKKMETTIVYWGLGFSTHGSGFRVWGLELRDSELM